MQDPEQGLFSIVHISAEQSEDLEQLGTKPKFWFRHNKQRTLFKAEHRGTGEDWAEIIAGEICDAIGLPHVSYQLAHETQNDLPGVICVNLAAKPLTLVLGNQLMLEADSTYPANTEQNYGVREHTVNAVAEVVKKLAPPPPDLCWQPTLKCHTAVDVFVGYVLLDTLIANQDRHHQNWGALRHETTWLAPTFDHGAGLARNEPDEKRARRLRSANRSAEMSAFARRAASGFYGSVSDRKTLRSLACFHAWQAIRPMAADHWLERLNGISAYDFERIIDRVPASRMTPLAKEFTLELLTINQDRLLRHGSSPP